MDGQQTSVRQDRDKLSTMGRLCRTVLDVESSCDVIFSYCLQNIGQEYQVLHSSENCLLICGEGIAGSRFQVSIDGFKAVVGIVIFNDVLERYKRIAVHS